MRGIIGFLCFLVVLASALDSVSRADDKKDPLSQSELTRFLDIGCSLIVARVIGIGSGNWRGIDITLYELRTLRALVPGDIKPRELASPIFVRAGTNHDLQQGKFYAVFIRRDIPGGYGMLFGTSIVPVNERDQAQIKSIVGAAASAYRASSIKAFREGKLKIKPTDLHLTQVLRGTLKSFRARPHERTSEGRAIWESDLGSRTDESRSYSSSGRRFLPPKHPLTSDQALDLLGKPTLISGFTYYWYCGPDPGPDSKVHEGKIWDGVQHYGVLTVRFEKTGLATQLIYTVFDDKDITDFHSKWR